MMKRFLYGTGAVGALTTAYLVGSLTLGGAFAQNPPPPPSPSPTVQAGPEAPGQEVQDPALKGSIQVPGTTGDQPEQSNGTEANEAAALQSLAKITADQAKTAALAQFPNATVGKVELDSENGSLVYSVHLTDTAGKSHDVKVDAGTSQVLQVSADGPEGAEGPQGAEGPDGAESGD